MIEFDENGHLKPYDIIKVDLVTVKQVFVDEMSFSTTRKRIFENYLEYLAILHELIPSGFTQWIDGSFTTRKRNPNDIDILTFIPFEIFKKNAKEIDKLRQWKYDKQKGIDGYFLELFPETHQDYKFFNSDYIEWYRTFSRNRSNQEKGIIELTF
jgi:hypothetical protein